MLRSFLVACLAVACAMHLDAQSPLARPSNPAPTGLILGKTVDSSDAPVAGSLVTLVFPPDRAGEGRVRRALTNTHGEFMFAGLPPGTFSVSARKDGYADAWLAGDRVTLSPGGRRTDVILRHVKHATVSGVATDDRGRAIPYGRVTIARRAIAAGHPRFDFAYMSKGGETDDRGVFRITGIPPGAYVLLFRPPQTLRIVEGGAQGPAARSFVYGTAVYPPGGADERPVLMQLTSGQVVENVELRASTLPAVRIRGLVRGVDGDSNVSVALIRDPTDAMSAVLRTDPHTSVRADGTFSFDAVLPGSYTLRATATSRMTRSAPSEIQTVVRTPEASVSQFRPAPINPSPRANRVWWASWAASTVAVGTDDVDALDLTLRPALRITGRVEFEGTLTVPGFRRTGAGVSLEPADGEHDLSRQSLDIDDDRRFSFEGLIPGRYVLNGQPSGAYLVRAALHGRDVLTSGLELGEENVDGLVLTLSDRPNAIAGVVTTARTDSTKVATVVIFPTDARLWVDYGEYSTRIRQAPAAGPNGTYEQIVPPGDYFVLATMDRLADDWADPANLRRLAGLASRVTVGIGERRQLNLTARAIE